MDEIKVSQLDAVDEVRDTDVIMEISGGANKKATIQQLKENIVKDEYGTETDTTYSQNYQNEHNVVVNNIEPTTSERVWFKKSKNIFIPTTTNHGTAINIHDGNVSVSNNEFTFNATGTDLYFGQVKDTNQSYSNECGTLYKVTPGETIKVLYTNNQFNVILITKYTSEKISLGYSVFLTNEATLEIPENCYYITIRIGKNNAVSGTTYKTKVMLAKGTDDITYEDYIIPSIIIDDTEFYSQEFINDAIKNQSSNIINVPYTDFTIATNHIVNALSIKYDKATGFCLLSFRITTKDNDPQYNTYNAWQNQFTIPIKYAPPSIVFNVVYNGSGSAGVMRVQPSSDSTNKGKVDIYGHASYFLTEGTICWYTNAGIE